MDEKKKKIKLTASGKRELEQELLELTTIKRSEIAEILKVAIAQGDLSENNEYDEAKNDQAKLEARIKELEAILKNVEIIDETGLDDGRVHLGSRVKVHDREFDEELIFKIVGSSESDPTNLKISDESPVGSALIGHTVGDVVTVETPGGVSTLVVLEITM